MTSSNACSVFQKNTNIYCPRLCRPISSSDLHDYFIQIDDMQIVS